MNKLKNKKTNGIESINRVGDPLTHIINKILCSVKIPPALKDTLVKSLH